jgi:hypothetical protein
MNSRLTLAAIDPLPMVPDSHPLAISQLVPAQGVVPTLQGSSQDYLCTCGAIWTIDAKPTQLQS